MSRCDVKPDESILFGIPVSSPSKWVKDIEIAEDATDAIDDSDNSQPKVEFGSLAVKPIFLIHRNARVGMIPEQLLKVNKSNALKERFRIVMNLRCELLEEMTKQDKGACDYLRQFGEYLLNTENNGQLLACSQET
jgi:hypothetical protein